MESIPTVRYLKDAIHYLYNRRKGHSFELMLSKEFSAINIRPERSSSREMILASIACPSLNMMIKARGM